MSKMNYNRPRKYDPLVTPELVEEEKRGARILAGRSAKGHKNPQAYLHGKVKRFTPEEIAQFVAEHPQYGPLSPAIAAKLQDSRGEGN